MNRFTRALVGGTLALATLASAGAASAAEGAAATALSRAQAGAHPGEGWSQYYGRGYGPRGYRRRGPGGGALAAGVIGGLAVGALAGSAIAASQAPYGYGPSYGYGPGVPAYGPTPVGNVYGHDPRWVQYCASRYRSFDPGSGTYLASDGYRYACQ